MNRIPELNGLRGLAILAILFEHVTHDMFQFGPFTGPNISPLPLISNGWTGLDLLFILSGAVLFAPYADGRRTMDSAWTFYWRRFLRLMPLYYLAIAVELIARPISWTRAAWLLSGLFDLDPSSTEPLWNWGLWVIDFAILFSIIFPALVLAWRRVGPGWLVPIAILVALLARVLSYLLVGAPFIFTIWGTASGEPYAAFGSLGHLDEFVFGMLLAHMRAAGAIGRSSAILIWPGLVVTLTAWIGLGYLGLVPSDWLPLLTGLAVTLLAIGYTLIVAAALSQAGLFSRLLNWRALQVIGMMSYSIYVWHVPILRLLRPNHANSAAFVLGSLVYIIAVFAVATISYRFIEFPRVRNWRSLFLLPEARTRIG